MPATPYLALSWVALTACWQALAESSWSDHLACATREGLFADELAAVATLSACYTAPSAHEDREYIAAILKQKDGYRFVVQPAEAGADQVRLRFQRHPEEILVALWHTHGKAGAHRHLFSPGDTALVAQMAVPFYLSDPWGTLRVFSPGDAPRRRLRESGLRAPRGSTPGTVLRTAATAPEATEALTALVE